jgi:hypothetical protein
MSGVTDDGNGRATPPDVSERAPRTSGDVAQATPVQIGLLLLLLLLALLALWVVWSLLNAT